MRPSKRAFDEIRQVILEPDINKHAEGSCFARFGDTQVLCTASLEDKAPLWLRNSGRGWVTAEYGMLPRSTGVRIEREACHKGQSGRTHEIQRLIGRSLRASVDLSKIPDLSIRVDCDVIQADGGTRTAVITGGFVALYRAFEKLKKLSIIEENPIFSTVSAISCGFYQGEAILDLDYEEDSSAETDANFVITGSGGIVEIQGTAEKIPFNREDFNKLLDLAYKGTSELSKIQKTVLGI